MPELPEVETVRRGLEPVLAGQTLCKVVLRRPDLRWPMPVDLSARVTGTRVTALRRRSKVILADLSSGDTMLIHLGMSGRVLIHAPDGASSSPGAFHHDPGSAGPHDHVLFMTGHGWTVVYNDPRRFGMIDLTRTDDLDRHRMLARLGPEPLGNRFDGPRLQAALAGKATPIKSALLDQRTVAGLGNIYVCEALHRAGISPRRGAGRISAHRIDGLVTAVRDVLAEAIAAGGSSLRDYRQTDGELGYFQHRFRVYDRDGHPCPSDGCTGTVRRIVQSGRATFYCAQCQR